MKQYSLPLTNASIDAISDETDKQLRALHYSHKNITIVRLSLEETLLKWQQKFGTDAQVEITFGKRFGKPYLRLSLAGDPCDPYEKRDEESDWGRRILSELDIAPEYTYKDGKNQVRLSLRRPKLNPLIPIFIAVAAAFLCGWVLGFCPENVRSFIGGRILPPLNDTFFGVLGMMAQPMVFCSIILGICGIGDVALLGKLGKKVILSCCAVPLGSAVLCAVLFPFVFSLSFSKNGASAVDAGSLLQMIFDMIPHNLVTPFVEGNMFHIIIIAAAFGVALLILGKSDSIFIRMIVEIRDASQKIMEWITAGIPYVIFILVLKNFLSGTESGFAEIVKPLVIGVLVMLAYCVLYIVISAVRLKISPILLLRKIMPIFTVGITTASSGAAFGEIVTCCEKKLGISDSLCNFSIPLGMILCMGSCSIDLMVCTAFCASSFGVSMSFAAWICVMINAAVLAVASPPVAGGILACYAVIFTQVGIPTEALAFAMTIGVLIDFVATACNVSTLPAVLAVQAQKLDMLDREKLTATK